jgi:hypothetical protein
MLEDLSYLGNVTLGQVYDFTGLYPDLAQFSVGSLAGPNWRGHARNILPGPKTVSQSREVRRRPSRKILANQIYN